MTRRDAPTRRPPVPATDPAIAPESPAFDYAALRRRIDEILSKKLFFIVGVLKSGTTWLQAILDGHPDISCSGEGHFTNFLEPNLRRAVNDYNNNITEKNKTIFKELKGYPTLSQHHLYFMLTSAICLSLSEQVRGRTCGIVGEKTPGNIRAMPLLHELFPAAKFVHVIRDGRDAVVSGWAHNLRIAPDWTRDTFGSLPRYVDTFAPTWTQGIRLGQSFGTKHPDRYFEIRYEELHRDPGEAIRRVLRFLDADASDPMVEGCREAGSFERLTGGREPGREDRRSHFRKGVVGDWRSQLDADAQRRFETHAGALLRQLGYA